MTSVQLPLQDIEAEQRVISKLLSDSNCINEVSENLTPQTFYLEEHQEIMTAIASIHLRGDRVTLTTVLAQLKNTLKILAAGGENKLKELAERATLIHDARPDAERLAELYTRRQLIAVGNEVVTVAHDTTKTVEEAVNESQEAVMRVEVVKQPYRSIEPRDSARQALDFILNGGQIYRIDQPDLDDLLGGFEPKTFTVIAARPSMGKTYKAGYLGHQIAAYHKLPVIYFSMEMSAVQLEYRLAALISVHPYYRNKNFSPFDSARIRQHRNKTRPLQDWEIEVLKAIALTREDIPLRFCEARGITTRGIFREVQRVKQKYGEVGLVIVDYIQRFSRSEGNDSNRAYDIGRAVDDLYDMSGKLEVPVLALSQVKREVESRQDKEPTMSDLSESSIIENAADTILTLFRDDYYNKQSEKPGILKINALKARLGETGHREVFFDRTTGLIRGRLA
jgi:replicative DNA helicase